MPVLRDLQRAARLVLRLRLPRNRALPDQRRRLRDALAWLDGLQRVYTRRVETAVRTAPDTPGAIAPLLVSLLERVVTQQDQIIGLLRYQVGLFPPFYFEVFGC